MASRRILYPVLGSLAMLVVVFLATPAGPWILGGLCTRLTPAYGWRLEIEGTSGRLLGTASFHQVRLHQPGTELALERLDLSVLSYAVEVVRPDFRLHLGAKADEAAPVDSALAPSLPVEFLPALRVGQGRGRLVQADGFEVLVEDLDLRYEAMGDSLGGLLVSLPHWAVWRQGQKWAAGGLRSRLELEPRRVSLKELRFSGRADTFEAELQGRGRLDLVAGLPAALDARAHLHTGEEAVQGQVGLKVRGGLQPLSLEVEIEGQATQVEWGGMRLRGRVGLEPDRVVVDTLNLDLLGGQVRGRATYLPTTDSLVADLRFEGLDLSPISGDATGGVARGTCRAGLHLGAQRYSADLALQLQQLGLPGGPFDVDLSAALRPDQSLRATLRSSLGHVQATGFFDPQGVCDLAVEGVVEPGPMVGREVDPVQVTGRIERDSLALRLETAHLPWGDREFGPLIVDLHLREQRFLEAALTLEEDQAFLRLRLDLAEGEIDSLVSGVAPLALGRLLPDLEGTLQGQVQGRGGLSPEAAQVSAQFELAGAAYRDWHTGPVQVRLEYQGQRATYHLEGQGFAAQAFLDTLKHFRAQVRLDQAVFQRISPESAGVDSGAQVVLSGTLDCRGRLDRPEALEADVALEHLALRQGAWGLRGDGPVRVRYSQQQAIVERLHLHTPLGGVQIKGSTRADSLDVVVEIAALELQRLAPDLQGGGRAWLEVGGTLDQPLVHSRVELHRIALAGQTFGDLRIHLNLSDTLSLKAILEQEQVPQAELDLTLPLAPVLQGRTTPPAGEAELRVVARQLDLQAPLSHLLADSARGVVGFEGAFSVPLALLMADSLRWADLNGQLEFRQLQVEKQGLRLELPPGGRIRREGDQVKMSDLGFAVEVYDPEARAFRPGGTLELEGQMAASRPSQLQLDLRELDLLVLENLGAGDLPQGKFDLQARLRGTRTDPLLDVDLNASLTDLGEVEGRFHGTATEGILELDWSTLIGDELQVRGRLPWDLRRREIGWEEGTLRAYSEGLSLLLLLDLLPELEDIDGTLSVDLELRGFDQEVEVQGRADVADLAFALFEVTPGYGFPSGRLEFAGRRGEFRDFIGQPLKGKGRLEVSGFVELQALDELVYEVRLKADDLPYNYDDIFDAPRTDMDLSMRSTASGSLLAGRVVLDRALVDLPLIDLNAPPLPPPPPAVPDEFLETMELDVEVDIRAMHVENELTDLDLEGNTRVYGTFYKPLFQGEMRIIEGKVFLLNSEFDFHQGRINLDRLVPTYSLLDLTYDPLLLNPELDLGAVTTVKPIDPQFEGEEYEISLALEGPLREVVPRFTSEPPTLEYNDLLKLVAFGFYGDSAVLLEHENRGALYSTAGRLLLSRQVKKIGLDEFQLLPSGTLLETAGEPSVHLGKYFKFPLPLWVRYEAVTKDPSLGEFRIEHRLRSYLTLTGTAQSEKNRYGLGVGIKKDF